MKAIIFFSFVTILQIGLVEGQPTFPSPQVNTSYIPPSPNAQAFQMGGNDPASVSNGAPSVNIPIYEVKCGSLSLPILLGYSYDGLQPLQDAGWVGLGWNLDVGGVISRIVEGSPDSAAVSHFHFGQYNLDDSVGSPNLNNFLAQPYDFAPDIFDAEFNGVSGKFFWCKGKAYLLDYNKMMGVSWPSDSSPITVTTEDGIAYIFGAKEVTTANTYVYGVLSSSAVFNSAWHLTKVISSDKRDTIYLNYASYTWQQAPASYQSTYAIGTGGSSDLGYDTTSFHLGPVIQAQVLQSITCRNSRISFVASTTLRTDVIGSYPSLHEIDVVDSITGTTVRKSLFSYEYFNQTTSNPQQYEHLKLKRFNSVDIQLPADTLTYSFSYVNEYGTNFPSKTTQSIDYWGYYNHSGALSLLPGYTSPYYVIPPSNFYGASNTMDPSLTYISYGALDTVVYPTGGYTVYQYQLNQYYNSSLLQTMPGPGICLSSATNYDAYHPGFALQKKYFYFQDDGITSSGVLMNKPLYITTYFITNTTGALGVITTDHYSVYSASNNSSGIGGMSPKFYYSKVTESVSSGAETHKSDYYFTGFNTLFQDVKMTKKVDYSNTPNTNYYTPVSEVDNSYAVTTDTTFFSIAPFISGENINHLNFPKIQYIYSYNPSAWSTYWIYLTTQTSIRYDINGNSESATTNYIFNPATRNISAIQQSTSDGQILIQKFKFPEDYTSALTGNMVASRVLSPAIEKETWLKRDVNDSALISGEVTQYDQTIFKPVSLYSIETTAPIQSLNNETISGGKYSSLLSTSQYVLKGQLQYDNNNNPSTTTKASDINVSYLYDYKHSQVVAQVKNAAQSDIAFCSFEADGRGNWTFSGASTAYPTSPQPPTGNYCYNLGQTSGNITKTGLTSSAVYIVSYWTTNSSALTIAGTQSGYPLKGKTINGWTYFEHKLTGQTSVTVSGTGYIDELRLYPPNAQMLTYTYAPLIGKTTVCDADNRITYFQYDGLGRLKWTKDQDGNILKTIQYHEAGQTTP